MLSATLVSTHSNTDGLTSPAISPPTTSLSGAAALKTAVELEPLTPPTPILDKLAPLASTSDGKDVLKTLATSLAGLSAVWVFRLVPQFMLNTGTTLNAQVFLPGISFLKKELANVKLNSPASLKELPTLFLAERSLTAISVAVMDKLFKLASNKRLASPTSRMFPLLHLP